MSRVERVFYAKFHKIVTRSSMTLRCFPGTRARLATFFAIFSQSPQPYALRQKHLLLALLVLMSYGPLGFSQNANSPGIEPFSTQTGSGYDAINLSSSNILLTFPIRTKSGPVPLSFALHAAPTLSINANSTYSWYLPNAGSLTFSDGLGMLNSGVQSTPASETCQPSSGVTDNYFQYNNVSIVDESGAAHPLSIGPMFYNPCSQTYSTPLQTTLITSDGSGYTALLTSLGAQSPPHFTVYDRSGNKVVTTYAGAATTSTLTTPNGVTVSSTYNDANPSTISYGDALNTTAFTGTYSNTLTPTSYSYLDSSGNTQTITVTYTSYTFRTAFGCSSISEAYPYAYNFPTKIALPDGRAFTIAYEPTPGYPADITGRIAKIGLPTGGTIGYTYTGGNNNAGVYCDQVGGIINDGMTPTIPILTRTITDGEGNQSVWTYTFPDATTPYGHTTTQVLDPAQNLTVYQFYAGYQTEQQIYQGSAANAANLLKTIVTCYNGNFSNCPAGSGSQFDVTQTDVYTSYNGGSSSLVETVLNTLGLPTDVKQFDYGAAMPPSGNPVVETKTSYGSWSGSACNTLSAYIQDHVCEKKVYNSSQTLLSDERNTYNSVGNLTSKAQLTSGGTYLTTSSTYNSNGTPINSTDSNGNITTYTFGACNNLLPTKTTENGQSTEETWDCNGGVITSETGANPGETTSYTYSDPLYRLTRATYPTGGTMSKCYSDVGGSLCSQSSTLNLTTTSITATPDPTQQGTETSDGLGRTISSTEASGAITDTTYDSMGNVSSVSNPYFTKSNPSYVTSYSHDTLGRVLAQCQPDNTPIGATSCVPNNSFQSYAYSGSQTTFTDENKNSWISLRDGLGRLSSVTEPVGAKTAYTYDGFGNVTLIQQTGVSGDTARPNRTFTYDGLSRLTSSISPEAGSTTFAYTTSSNALCSGNASDVCSRTDARGVTTTYTYDGANRITSKHYSDGTNPAFFGYDGNNSSGGTLPANYGATSNVIGRLTYASNSANADEGFGYDPMGRITTETYCLPVNCANRQTVSASYDLAGNMTSLAYPDGRVVGQTFDAAGRMSAINYQSWNGTSMNQAYLSESSGYDPAGHLINASFGNGVAYTAGYDNRERMGTLAYGPTSGPLWSKQFAWTANSNLQSQTDLITGVQRQFNYDNLNRLTAAQDIYSNLAVASGSNDNTGSTSSSGSGAEQTPGTTGAQPQWTDPDESNLLTDIGSSSSNWAVESAVVAPNAAVAPDGSMTATTVTATSGSTDTYVQGSPATSADYSLETMTGSVWLRSLSGTQTVDLFVTTTFPGGYSVAGSKQVQLTTSWAQYHLTAAASNNVSSLFWQIGGGGTVTSGQGFIMWNPMLEDEGIAGTSVTNFAPSSQRFGNWNNTQGTASDNSVVAPDGTTTAATLTASGTASDNCVIDYLSNVVPFSGQAVTGSVWLKVPSGTTTVNLTLYEGNSSGGSPLGEKNITLTTSWQRFQVEGTTESGLSSLVFQIGGAGSFASGKVIHAWGGQVELATQAGPYIATDTVPSTMGTNLMNLVPYSQQLNEPGWSVAGGNVTRSNTAAPDGSLTATLATSATGASSFSPSVSIPNPVLWDGQAVIGSVYLRVASGTLATAISLTSTNGQGSQAPSTNVSVTTTWQRFTVTSTLQTALTALGFQVASGLTNGQSIQIWGPQLELGSHPEPYIATSTLAITVGSEPVNILPNSQTSSGANWGMGAGSVTSTTASAPDGTGTAAVFVASSGSQDSYITVSVPNPSLYDSETITASVFLRLNTATSQQLNLYLNNNGDQGLQIAKTSTVTLTSAWQRFDLTATLQNGLTQLYLQVGGGSTLTGGESYQIWGAQFVVGSDPAPYTPTPTSTTVYATGQPGTLVQTGLNQSYSYDSFGNILQNGSFNSSYTANNQMFGYAYDAAGNLLSDGMNTMTWDAENRISTVSGATYIYDAQGDRVEKQGASVVDIVYFGGHPLARYSAGQWTDLIYGPTGLLVEVPGLQNAPPVYRATDHLGTNVGSFLANGTFTEPVDHTPFGQVFTGNTSDPYLFTGKERDAESGLDYFGARYMSSNMGRFYSPDPSALSFADPNNPQSFNLYSYVLNNPLIHVDPNGLSCGDTEASGNQFSGGQNGDSPTPPSDPPQCAQTNNTSPSVDKVITFRSYTFLFTDYANIQLLSAGIGTSGIAGHPGIAPNNGPTWSQKNKACLDKINSSPDGKFYNFFSPLSMIPGIGPEWKGSIAEDVGGGLAKFAAYKGFSAAGSNWAGTAIGVVGGELANTIHVVAEEVLAPVSAAAMAGQLTVHAGCAIAAHF